MPSTSRTRRALVVASGLLLVGAGILAVAPAAAAAPPPVDVQLLALNDFHGNLEPPRGSSGTIAGVPAGGVEFLATQLAALESEVRKQNTITVAAGDLIGATPLLSAAFHDEPTVERSPRPGSTSPASATTSSTRGPASCCASRTAAATRSTAAPTPPPRTRARTSGTSRPTRS